MEIESIHMTDEAKAAQEKVNREEYNRATMERLVDTTQADRIGEGMDPRHPEDEALKKIEVLRKSMLQADWDYRASPAYKRWEEAEDKYQQAVFDHYGIKRPNK